MAAKSKQGSRFFVVFFPPKTEIMRLFNVTINQIAN